MKALLDLGFRELNYSDRYAWSVSSAALILDVSDEFELLIDMPSTDNEGTCALILAGKALVDVASVTYERWYVEYIKELVELVQGDREYAAAIQAYNKLWDKGRDYVDAHMEEEEGIIDLLKHFQAHYEGFFDRARKG